MIPFVDLRAQYQSIKKEIDQAISSVIDTSSFIQGDEVQKFEEAFAKYIGVQYCVGVNSGTDALILGMRGLELPKNSEILIPVNTYISTALAASENGLKPVFVDIDSNDYGINLVDLEKKITSKTSAIILAHLSGQSDKIDQVKAIIKRSGRNILLIEDAAQSHGAIYKKNKVGTFGIYGIFSFYPGKNLGAYGDGGAIVTNNKKLAQKCKQLREYGQSKKYYHDSIGICSRLDTIQAAILRAKLPHLDSWNKKRLEHAQYYSKKIQQRLPFIITPQVFMERESVYHLYIIRVKRRNKLLSFLQDNGVKAQIHYPVPLHLQKAYKHLGYKKGDFPIAEKIAEEIISLPIYPELTKKQIDVVVSNIETFYKK